MTDLDPIRILRHKADDDSLSAAGRRTLTHAAMHVECAAQMREWWSDTVTALDTLY